MPPWEVRNETPTRWTRYKWRVRHNIYSNAVNERNARIMEEAQLRNLRRG